MLARERRALAERHVGAQVVSPHVLGVAHVAPRAPLEEQHVGLHARRVEDARRQPQDGVQVALVHQVGADLLPGVVLKENIVGKHHGSPSTGLEVPVDVLDEGQLLVAG